MFKFKVSPDGRDWYVVTATARDVAKWERTTKGAAAAQLNRESLRFADLYKVAYYGSIRQGLYTGTMAEFEESCDIDPLSDEEDESADPTQPAQ